MSDIKELRSIELSSYTTLSTGIAVLFSIISAILFSILVGVAVPNGASVIIYVIPTIIVGTFMFTIYNAFCQGLLYNLLAKKLKTIFFILKDNKEIVKISTTETAIMVSIILTIQVILLYLVSVLILPLLLTTVMQTLMYSGQQLTAINLYQLLLLISQPATIAMFIFGTFILTFIFVLIGTYIYNILGKNGRGVVLNLSEENGFTAIDSIDAKKFAIAYAIITCVINIIFAIIMLISGAYMSGAIIDIISGFIGGFIVAYLFALFYNYLAPKLGKLKIELIDIKIN